MKHLKFMILAFAPAALLSAGALAAPNETVACRDGAGKILLAVSLDERGDLGGVSLKVAGNAVSVGVEQFEDFDGELFVLFDIPTKIPDGAEGYVLSAQVGKGREAFPAALTHFTEQFLPGVKRLDRTTRMTCSIR